MIFDEELAVTDEQWLGGPHSLSVSGVRCGSEGKLNE